jgi:NAD(P)H-dependent flavin oxidoreductase YrpB (nitropropane dioxygenase family)
MERIGVEVPIVQAGMGGGLAGHELAAVVPDAGELGTIGILGPESLVDAGPLYAGECIERIGDIRSARELVREPTP